MGTFSSPLLYTASLLQDSPRAAVMLKTTLLFLLVSSSFTKHVPVCLRPATPVKPVPRCPEGWSGYFGGLTPDGLKVDPGCYQQARTRSRPDLEAAKKYCMKQDSRLAYAYSEERNTKRKPLVWKTFLDLTYPGNTCRDTNLYLCVKDIASILSVEPYQEEPEEIVASTPTYVTTYLGTKPGPSSFNMSYMAPVLKYSLYESVYAARRLCTGFKWEDYNGNEHSEGNVDINLATPTDGTRNPIVINLGSDGSDFITGIKGRSGALIDQLLFERQSGQIVPPCGGVYGSFHDATPRPSTYGTCILFNIAGTYFPGINNNLATLEFIWQCQRNF